MDFDKVKNFLGVDIKNGVKGEATVLNSSDASSGSDTADLYGLRILLEVRVEGWEPYQFEHHCMVAREDHPADGFLLPVTVDPENRERLQIHWDQVVYDVTVDVAGTGEQTTISMADMLSYQQRDLEAEQEVLNANAEAAMAAAKMMAPPAAPAPSGAPDPMDRLSELGKLREGGLITQAEFEAKKAEILREI